MSRNNAGENLSDPGVGSVEPIMGFSHALTPPLPDFKVDVERVSAFVCVGVCDAFVFSFKSNWGAHLFQIISKMRSTELDHFLGVVSNKI